MCDNSGGGIMPKKYETIGIRPETKESLKKLAKRENRSVAAQIEVIYREWKAVKREKK